MACPGYSHIVALTRRGQVLVSFRLRLPLPMLPVNRNLFFAGALSLVCAFRLPLALRDRQTLCYTFLCRASQHSDTL